MKLSKWIDGKKFVPAHVGVYETKDFSEIWGCFPKCYWDGKEWSVSWHIESAMHYSKMRKGFCQSPNFRGLAEKPNKQEK